jgi:ABC-type multidrug transport system fused ATPase/permease subunit
MLSYAAVAAAAAARSLLTCSLGAVMMFITSWKLATLTCATLPVTLLAFRIFAREQQPMTHHI